MEPINLSKSNARCKPGWKLAPIRDIWPACLHPPPQLWSKQPLCALLSANVWHTAASFVDHELARIWTMHLKLLSTGFQAWTWSLHLIAVNRSRLPLSWQKATWAQTRCLHLHTCRTVLLQWRPRIPSSIPGQTRLQQISISAQL